MKLVELIQRNGDRIVLNPLRIVAIVPVTGRDDYNSYVRMSDASSHCVKECYADIVDKVSEAVA
jgi:hypothetical protein